MLKNTYNFNYNIQKLNEEKFLEFLNFIEHLLCKRCWKNENNIINDDAHHHHGGFLYLLNQNPKISKENFEKWKSDTEHGFLHGFLVSFFYFCLSKDQIDFNKEISKDAGKNSIAKNTAIFKNYKEKELKVEKIIYSCLFHDFVKVCYNEEPHDLKLKSFFPECLEETYNHSFPSENSNLISADRMELVRYEDYKNWCDTNMFKNEINSYGKLEFFHFFKHIRPFLKTIIENENEIWFSHIIESNIKNIKYYPETRWLANDEFMPQIEEMNKYFSVHDGKLPIKNCHKHALNTVLRREKNNITLMGLIPKKTIKKHNNEIVSAPDSTWGRDHVFIKENNKMLIEDWNFTYIKKEDLNFIETTNIKLLEVKILNKFLNIKEKLHSKIESLKVE